MLWLFSDWLSVCLCVCRDTQVWMDLRERLVLLELRYSKYTLHTYKVYLHYLCWPYLTPFLSSCHLPLVRVRVVLLVRMALLDPWWVVCTCFPVRPELRHYFKRKHWISLPLTISLCLCLLLPLSICLQGPRGLPGERGRPGAAGSAVSDKLTYTHTHTHRHTHTHKCTDKQGTRQTIPMHWNHLTWYHLYSRAMLNSTLSLRCTGAHSDSVFCFLQGARGNDGLPGPAGPPVSRTCPCVRRCEMT